MSDTDQPAAQPSPTDARERAEALVNRCLCAEPSYNCEETAPLHYNDLVLAIAAALSSSDVNKWQPIETHPKHDDDVLLLFANEDIAIAFWRGDANAWDNTESGWIKGTPTHWMPIPEPPTATDVEQKERR